MLYSKPEWSCVALTDMLAPVAKMVLQGDRLILAMPIACVTSTMRASGKGTLITVSSLCHAMLCMSMSEFLKGGGMLIYMKPGDFCWLPECCVVAEFNMWHPDISTSLTWLAMTEHHCANETLTYVAKSVRTMLSCCSEPSQKGLEEHYQAGQY